MNSNNTMIKKLRNAINLKGHKLVYNTAEVFLENQQFPVRKYTIKRAEKTKNGNGVKYIELFHTFSQIQIVLFLRDYWYLINNIQLPTDNPKWNDIRETIPVLNDDKLVAGKG